LVLPKDFQSKFSCTQRRLILNHEYVHARRRDSLSNVAGIFLRNMFWFNPFVWLSYSRFRFDQEVSCDYYTTKDESPQLAGEYAEAMLNATTGNNSPALMNPWLGSKDLQERIKMLKFHHSKSINKWLKASLLAPVTFICIFAGATLSSQELTEDGRLLAEVIPEQFVEMFNDYNRTQLASQGLSLTRTDSVPADSEYIAFVIDTSGSMMNTPGSWRAMQAKIPQVIAAYPNARGFQIVNDMGWYLIRSQRRTWIPVTEESLNAAIAALEYWNPYSNSSPVEGLAEILEFSDSSSENISIYILGDDVKQDLSEIAVLAYVESANVSDDTGKLNARIHAVMLPNLFEGPPRYRDGAYRFANIMRTMAQRNGGTFELLDSI